MIRRTQTINDTKIKYILVADTKVYEVTSIKWLYSEIEAKETELSIDDVSEAELWDILYFKDYKIRLVNGDGGIAEIIDFAEWIRTHIM